MAGCRRIGTCRNMLSGCDGQPTCFRNKLPHLNPSLAQPPPQGKIFGDSFPLRAVGAAGLPADTLIPGVAVFSRRAEALAAWTSGVELAAVFADADRACLIMETGVNDRFRCADA